MSLCQTSNDGKCDTAEIKTVQILKHIKFNGKKINFFRLKKISHAKIYKFIKQIGNASCLPLKSEGMLINNHIVHINWKTGKKKQCTYLIAFMRFCLGVFVFWIIISNEFVFSLCEYYKIKEDQQKKYEHINQKPCFIRNKNELSHAVAVCKISNSFAVKILKFENRVSQTNRCDFGLKRTTTTSTK